MPLSSWSLLISPVHTPDLTIFIFHLFCTFHLKWIYISEVPKVLAFQTTQIFSFKFIAPQMAPNYLNVIGGVWITTYYGIDRGIKSHLKSYFSWNSGQHYQNQSQDKCLRWSETSGKYVFKWRRYPEICLVPSYF